MVLLDRLRSLAYRWWLLAGCAVVGAVGAGAPDPPPAEELRGAPFSAAVTLIPAPGAPAPAAGWEQALGLGARLADRTDVARLAAQRLGSTADPLVLAAAVDARADLEIGAVVVTARGEERDLTIATAQAFGEATASYVQSAAGFSLRSVGATTIVERGWLHLPAHRPGRALLGALAGLLLGALGGILLPNGRHGRLYGRASFEAAYGVPVLAEIPRLHGSVRQFGDIAVTLRPNGPVAEAYRGLRSAALRPGSEPGTGLADVIAVTSPRPQDGRSTVVANLAAALAEAGRAVLVIDADFGNPTAHLYLGRPPYTPAPQGPGLAELLQSPEPAYELPAALRQTVVPGVGLIAAGQDGRLPTSLLVGLPAVLAEARRCADFVILDGGPVLTSQDAVDLLQQAATVLLVGRPGRTSAGHAARARFALGRARVGVAGIVLVGTVRDPDVSPTYAVPAGAEPAAAPLPDPAAAPVQPPQPAPGPPRAQPPVQSPGQPPAQPPGQAASGGNGRGVRASDPGS